MTDIRCWRCGATLDPDTLPLRRADVCPACDADLHVCRQCTFYNPGVADACEEPIATSVGNKERANYCDYFKPSPRAFKGAAAGQDTSRAALDALFGGGGSAPASTDPERNLSELERLFGIERK
jgi:hypothetical protein